MDYAQILQVLNEYGLLIVFAFGVAEYSNLPGLPATPILMAVGAWGRANSVLIGSIVSSLAGGIIGMIILYFVGRFFGKHFMPKYYKRFPKHKVKIDHYIDKIDNGKPHYIAIARVIPVLRTLISIPAGMLGVELRPYVVYSFAGMLAWNLFFILAGSGAFEIFMGMTK